MMDVDIFQKLMLSRQLSFSEGSIELLGNRISMIGAEWLPAYTYGIEQDQELVQQLYRSTKAATRDGIGKLVSEKHNFNVNDTVRLFIEIMKMEGWGIPSWNFSTGSKKGTMTVENPVGTSGLKGKTKLPADHYLRGMLAGCASALYKSDIDVIEVKCIALGSPKCEFAYDDAAALAKSYPELAEYQLGK